MYFASPSDFPHNIVTNFHQILSPPTLFHTVADIDRMVLKAPVHNEMYSNFHICHSFVGHDGALEIGNNLSALLNGKEKKIHCVKLYP